MDLDDSAINESIFKVRVFTHRFEKTLEYTGLGPPAKPPELAVPMAKGRWQIAPRRAGAHPPQDRFQKQTIVFCRCSGIADLTWKVRLKPLPQDVRVEATISVVSGKWKPILLYQMRDGAKRYSELHRLVPQASERMLVRSLRELEQDHLIQRKVYKQVPARVEYALTADGESLIPVLSMMSVWGNERKYA